MAYLTLTYWGRDITSAELQALNQYILDKVSTGVTNGIETQVDKTGVVDAEGNKLILSQRSWTTQASAQDFIDYRNTFVPAPTYGIALEAI